MSATDYQLAAMDKSPAKISTTTKLHPIFAVANSVAKLF
jgi:hypothetical protein